MINQLKEEYAAKNDCMAAYMKMTNSLLAKFDHHELNQITRDQNTHVDALACLASAINAEIKRTIEIGFIPKPSIGPSESVQICAIESGPSNIAGLCFAACVLLSYPSGAVRKIGMRQ